MASILASALMLLGAVGMVGMSFTPGLAPGASRAVVDIAVDASVTKVFLPTQATDAELVRLASEVDAIPHVEVTDTTTADEALEEASELFVDAPEVMENLPGNPFPPSLTIEIDEAHRDSALAAIEQLDGVDQVATE